MAFDLWDNGYDLTEIFKNYSSYFTISSVFVLFALAKTLQWYCTKKDQIIVTNIYKKHNWKLVHGNLLKPNYYCSICEALLLHDVGYYCDCCGICADKNCLKKAERQFKCKIISAGKDEFEHHWVKGNLSSNAVCIVCDDDCSLEPGLSDYQCCWCHRTVHEKCKDQLINQCDMGPLRRLIIPPWSVQASGGSRFNRRLGVIVHKIIHPGWSDWTPLIIIANRKSGSNEADKILSLFRYYLNPIQVLDISDKISPNLCQWGWMLTEALRQSDVSTQLNEGSENILQDTMNKCRFLVAGGDGTVASTLNILHNMGIKPEPSVAILPLGTGNDLSRVLGWGKETSSDFDPTEVLLEVIRAEQVFLDRWMVEITPYRHLVGLRMPVKSLFMYNYFSIGVDAQVTLDFHRTREGPFYICSSRFFNKLLYLLFGTQQAIAANCQNLQDLLELWMDGVRVELPSIESIVVLNIPSWGAGVSLWSLNSDDKVPTQSINDGKIEVMAIYSSFHIGQLQMGLSQPHRLGQAKLVEIKLYGSAPVQVDGEPWKQSPSTIRIEYVDQACVLKKIE